MGVSAWGQRWLGKMMTNQPTSQHGSIVFFWVYTVQSSPSYHALKVTLLRDSHKIVVDALSLSKCCCPLFCFLQYESLDKKYGICVQKDVLFNLTSLIFVLPKGHPFRNISFSILPP